VKAHQSAVHLKDLFTLRADLNNDNTVNSLDWSVVNASWFTNNTTADINRDGIVNSLDFSILNGEWGN
jgi:hypothetical protein